MSSEGRLEFLLDLALEGLEVALMIFDLLQQLRALLLFFLELDAKHALLYEFLEVLLTQTSNVIFLIGIDLFLVLFLEELFDLLFVEARERIGSDDL